jgi:tRNA(Arg) A34 adenosine deaminase TadA
LSGEAQSRFGSDSERIRELVPKKLFSRQSGTFFVSFTLSSIKEELLLGGTQVSKPQTGPKAPVLSQEEPLGIYWDKSVSAVASLDQLKLDPGTAERHRIYSLAVMSMVRRNWNGNKNGTTGNYPWREKQKWLHLKDNVYLYRCRPLAEGEVEAPRRDYLGHNIACMAVDGDGDIIDFDFNHNNVFGSSVEHAESRLIRRIFSLTQLNEGWNLAGTSSTSALATNLSNVTIYTSLESCAQCAGIMTLAGVKEVVYLQKDFGTYCIGNILYNLTLHVPGKPSVSAPRPIPASDFGLEYYDQLNDTYHQFYDAVPDKPFYTDGLPKPQKIDNVQAVTSFLCTDAAYEIYSKAHSEFLNFKVKVQDHTPPPLPTAPETGIVSKPKSNAEVLDNAQRFVDRMQIVGRRGTAHKL